jgi:hypothetical protein
LGRPGIRRTHLWIEDALVSIEDFSGPLPRLVGSPAYARPPGAVATAPRPFDPDELPLEVFQTEEEREFAARLPARAFAPGGADVRLLEQAQRPDEVAPEAPEPSGLRPRQRSLSDIAGRLLGRP